MVIIICTIHVWPAYLGGMLPHDQGEGPSFTKYIIPGFTHLYACVSGLWYHLSSYSQSIIIVTLDHACICMYILIIIILIVPVLFPFCSRDVNAPPLSLLMPCGLIVWPDLPVTGGCNV